MPPVEQIVGDDWITTSYDQLCVGDAITATIAVMRKGPDGQPLRKVNEKTGRPYYPRDRVTIRGRIVGLDYSRLDALVVERTKFPTAVPRHALLPEFIVTLTAADLTTDFVQLWRNVRSGPKVRTCEAGEAYLLDLLRRAAGGDDKDQAAVERVALCVHPNARSEDPVYDLGIRRATGMLRGEETFSESVYRQLKGWERTPNAEMRPTKVPRTTPRRATKKETEEQREERLRLLAEHPNGAEILAIMQAIPGVSIREVRLRSDPEAEAKRRELAGGDPNSPAVPTTPFVDTPSIDVSAPDDGADQEIVYHDDEESDDFSRLSANLVTDP